ncbi:hypothetical protein ACQKMN_16925 [Ureibacillus composti]
MKYLIEVNQGYYMMMADSYKSFFAIQSDEGWQVLSVDLAYYPNEKGHGFYTTKEEALQQLLQLVKHWQSKKHTNSRRTINNL